MAQDRIFVFSLLLIEKWYDWNGADFASEKLLLE